MDHQDYRNQFEKIFSFLNGSNHERFFEFLDNNVTYIDQGEHAFGGTFHGLQDVQSHAFEGIHHYLRTPLNFEINKMIIEGNCATFIMNASAKDNNGKNYLNHCCFYAEMNPQSKKIMKIEAFYDTFKVHQLVKDNAPQRKSA